MRRLSSCYRPSAATLACLGWFAAVLLTVSVPHASQALTVTLGEWDPGSGPLATRLESTANNELCCGGKILGFDPVSIPFIDSHRAESGGVIAETAYSLTSAGFSIVIAEHSRLRRSAAISNGAIYFSIDVDTPYELTGNYSMAGFGDVRLEATLWDLSSGVLVFDSLQESWSTLNEMFELGAQEGDRLNRLAGSPSGALQAEHLYRLTYRAGISSSDAGDPDASASGSILLTLVPEPSTASLLGFGLAGLAARRRRLNP